MNNDLSNPEENSGEENQRLLSRLLKHKAFIPIVLFLFVIILFSFSSQFSDRPPEIEGITPEIGVPGDVLIITGNNFGESRSGGEVLIAGTRPVSSSYIEWGDERISVRIPNDAGSGMVFVTTSSGRSKGALFTNRNHIPIVLEGPSQPGYPYISEVSPSKGTVGTLIHLRGINFGAEKGNNEVYFSSLVLSGDENSTFSLAACDCSFDYVQWRENEIAVRVPDGATSGNIYVQTDRGTSNSVYFEVASPVGSKLVGERQGYQLQYGVTISDVTAESENWVYLWLQKIQEGLEQNNMETVNDPTPFWDGFSGMNVYHFRNMNSEYVYKVSQTAWFDRYTVETRIDAGEITPYDTERRLFVHYTAQDEHIPASAEAVGKITEAQLRWEKNPYKAAERLYSYVRDTLEYNQQKSWTDLDELFESETADAYGYTVLYCSLLRNAGIPARPVGGLLVYGDKKTTAHYWTEFYLEGFGWVPADPVLGDGVRFEDIPSAEDPAEYYFGNIDNRHIAFSKGISEAIRIKPDGQIMKRPEAYGLQTIHEEVSPNIQNYRAVWQKPRVIDWW